MGLSNMLKHERLSANYIFFRSPVEYVIIVIPSIIALGLHIINAIGGELTNYTDLLVLNLQYEQINQLLTQIEISTVILLSFLFCYKWVDIINNGTYSFWLIHGVTRRKFFIYSIMKFVGLLYFGQLLGVISLLYLNQYHLPLINFLLLNIGILSHLLVILSIAVFLAEINSNPEITALSYLFIMAAIILIITDEDHISHKIVRSNLHYLNLSSILTSLISIGIAFFLFGISIQLHSRADLDT